MSEEFKVPEGNNYIVAEDSIIETVKGSANLKLIQEVEDAEQDFQNKMDALNLEFTRMKQEAVVERNKLVTSAISKIVRAHGHEFDDRTNNWMVNTQFFMDTGVAFIIELKSEVDEERADPFRGLFNPEPIKGTKH